LSELSDTYAYAASLAGNECHACYACCAWAGVDFRTCGCAVAVAMYGWVGEKDAPLPVYCNCTFRIPCAVVKHWCCGVFGQQASRCLAKMKDSRGTADLVIEDGALCGFHTCEVPTLLCADPE
jgi:hypothetical protein